MCGGDVTGGIDNALGTDLSGNNSRSGGAGSGIGDPLHNLSDLEDFATQIITSGAAGYKNGKLGTGVAINQSMEGIGQVDGNNAARDATYKNQQAANAAAADQAAQISAAATQRQNNDVSASTTAAALRAGAANQSRNTSGALVLSGGSSNPTSDFLGL